MRTYRTGRREGPAAEGQGADVCVKRGLAGGKLPPAHGTLGSRTGACSKMGPVMLWHRDRACAEPEDVSQLLPSEAMARKPTKVLTTKVPRSLIVRATRCAKRLEVSLPEFVRRCVEGRVNQIEASRK